MKLQRNKFIKYLSGSHNAVSLYDQRKKKRNPHPFNCDYIILLFFFDLSRLGKSSLLDLFLFDFDEIAIYDFVRPHFILGLIFFL